MKFATFKLRAFGQSQGSISARLTRELLLAMGVLWLLMSLGVTWYVQREIEDACDESLITSAARLLELAAHEVDEVREHRVAVIAPLPAMLETADTTHLDLHSLTYQIVANSGQILMRSKGAPSTNIAPEFRSGLHTIGAWRVFSMQHPTEALHIHVADSLAHINEERRGTIVWLLLPMLAAFPLFGWVIRRITRRSLAPIEGLVAEIAARGVTNMEPVGGLGLPAEVQMISESTNHLLMRLKEALDVERTLAANAAHELRTPLTAARLRLACALNEPLPDAARAAMDEAAASLDRLSRRAEKLLQMSRAEASAAIRREVVDLRQLAREVADEFAGDADAAPRIKVVLQGDQPIAAVGDFDALALALRNLIENSLRYAPGATVQIDVRTPAVSAVTDNGDGVDPSVLKLISARHVRRSANQGGYGLGLSIVKTVVDRHNAVLQIFSPPPGRAKGFAAVIVLHAAPAGLSADASKVSAD